MAEEIIKECKNCDALGIDSEIGVYYCCLSHRQDDLPKEFTCDDFTPNKQLLCLEQENKALQAYKDINEDFKKAWDELNEKHKRCRSALEEIRKAIKSYDLAVDNGVSVDTLYTIGKIINEVLQ